MYIVRLKRHTKSYTQEQLYFAYTQQKQANNLELLTKHNLMLALTAKPLHVQKTVQHVCTHQSGNYSAPGEYTWITHPAHEIMCTHCLFIFFWPVPISSCPQVDKMIITIIMSVKSFLERQGKCKRSLSTSVAVCTRAILYWGPGGCWFRSHNQAAYRPFFNLDWSKRPSIDASKGLVF